MAQCLLIKTPNMNRAAVKARISPPSKAVHEKLIRQCMQRMKSQRRQAIEASRVRGLGLHAEHRMFRGLLYEQMQQQESKGDGEAHELRAVAQEEVAVEEEQLDEDDELLHALGRDNYDEFMIWLEQGLRAELEVMERQQAEEDGDGEFDEFERLEEEELNIASQLTEIAQGEETRNWEHCGQWTAGIAHSCGFSLVVGGRRRVYFMSAVQRAPAAVSGSRVQLRVWASVAVGEFFPPHFLLRHRLLLRA